MSLFALSIPWARQVYDETETNCADMFDFEIGFDGKDCTIKSFACSMTLIHYRTTVNGKDEDNSFQEAHSFSYEKIIRLGINLFTAYS